jgi:hypothetical protein
MKVAQYNVAKLKGEPEELPDFLKEVKRINAIGDEAPGFVWRYEVSEGNSLEERVQDDLIVNLTVWDTVQDLWNFSYQGGHLEALHRRREWFEYVPNSNVLWWVPSGHYPSVKEAEERLAMLRLNGPDYLAFTFNWWRDSQPVGLISTRQEIK